jgi:hypothetical protein
MKEAAWHLSYATFVDSVFSDKNHLQHTAAAGYVNKQVNVLMTSSYPTHAGRKSTTSHHYTSCAACQ